MQEFKSTSIAETKKIAISLAKHILNEKPNKNSAKVIALEGELGSGKTTFSQAFARALGIREKITSPTFVILKTYKLQATSYKFFMHIDFYRLGQSSELAHLGFKKILQDKDAIVLIEWADRVRKLLPKNTVWIKFRHGGKSNERVIKFSISKV